MLAAVVIGITIVVVVALIVWMWTTRRVPERASSHGDPDRPHRETDDLAAGIDRPADPNAEAQYPVIGDAAPGPPSGDA